MWKILQIKRSYVLSYPQQYQDSTNRLNKYNNTTSNSDRLIENEFFFKYFKLLQLAVKLVITRINHSPITVFQSVSNFENRNTQLGWDQWITYRLGIRSNVNHYEIFAVRHGNFCGILVTDVSAVSANL